MGTPTLSFVVGFPLVEAWDWRVTTAPGEVSAINRTQDVGWEPKRYVLTQSTVRTPELALLQDAFDEVKGMAGRLTWTPPGGSEGTYRLLSDELEINQHGPNFCEVRLELQQVRTP